MPSDDDTPRLTPRQGEILQFVRECLEREARPPTRAEIASAFGFRSANAAEEHLRVLARKGLIDIDAGAARGIRLRGGLGLPLIRRVAAGRPILAEAHIQGRYQIDPLLFKPRADYLLKVRGLSMIEDPEICCREVCGRTGTGNPSLVIRMKLRIGRTGIDQP